MNLRMLIVLFVAGLLWSCDYKQAEMSQRVIDSLRSELEVNHKMNETLAEIGTLIDSIDANRNMLQTRMLEGAGYESYVARMRDINEYVKKSEDKLIALQRTAKKSNDAALKGIIKRLKADLDVRNHELEAMKEQIALVKTENEGLNQKVTVQTAEIADKTAQLLAKQEQATQLEQQVDQLMTKSKADQGEALFAHAGAVEETANRTKFAPRKKKNTWRLALELYKQSLFYGKDEARERIAVLEKKLL